MSHDSTRSTLTVTERHEPLSPDVLFDIEMIRCTTIHVPWRVLALGEKQDTDRVVERLMRDHTGPVHEWCADESVPLRLHGSGTIIIRDVERLTRAQQATLLEFITSQPSMSTIAISSESLWRSVQVGEFSETLFYRLNILTIAATTEKVETPR